MNTIKEFAAQGIKNMGNAYGEVRHSEYHEDTNTASVIFPNGWVASIIRSNDDPTKWSVAVCDYNGYFDWDVLKPFGTKKATTKEGRTYDTGCVICDTEERVCEVLQGIKSFH